MTADRLVNVHRLGFGGKAMVLQSPIGLDRLMSEDRPDPSAPCAREMQVALQDANGAWPHPLADAAGSARAVGGGCTECRPGDQVVSCFFPDWQDGAPIVGDFRRTPGNGIDGFARAHAMLPATAFTRAPKGCDAVEAATITLAALTAWRALVVNAKLEAGDMVYCSARAASRSALQIGKLMDVQVTITSSSGEKLNGSKAMGADFTLSYREQLD